MSLLKSFAVFLALSFVTIQATALDHYYSTAFSQQLQALRDQPLKDMLNRTLTNNHHAIGYDNARAFIFKSFYPVSQHGVFIVKDVYCEKDYQVPGPKGLPSDAMINVEHTWPQSKFTGGYPNEFQKSDLHHLFPSDSHLNSDRSSYPFGEVSADKKTLTCRESRLGTESVANQLVFEPPTAHKGNVARALFYFSVRYRVNIDPTQEAYLRKWNQMDPVDRAEMLRNDAIFKLQGNRNPFVDVAGIADRIRDF